jgi:HEPN domain-containing protein
MKDNKQDAKRWFSQALRDLDDANFNLKGERFNIACFLSQQSAEKALKAYLFLKGADEVWGHSVGELCEDAKSLDESFKEIESACKSLDKYYIPTRYPDSLPGGIPSESFDRDDAEKALTLADKIIKFIRSRSAGEL